MHSSIPFHTSSNGVLPLHSTVFTLIRITLMFWQELPSFRCGTQEHPRDLDPSLLSLGLRGVFLCRIKFGFEDKDEKTLKDPPNSSLPLNTPTLSLILGGNLSNSPSGTYRYWNESASHKYRRVVLIPVVSEPKWL